MAAARSVALWTRTLSSSSTSFREARVGYTRWGAHAKARQLEQLFPELHARSVLGGTLDAPVELLDLTTGAQGFAGGRL
jgi:hypothetical protein